MQVKYWVVWTMLAVFMTMGTESFAQNQMDFRDFVRLASEWYETRTVTMDLNGDGIVDQQDVFALWADPDFAPVQRGHLWTHSEPTEIGGEEEAFVWLNTYLQELDHVEIPAGRYIDLYLAVRSPDRMLGYAAEVVYDVSDVLEHVHTIPAVWPDMNMNSMVLEREYLGSLHFFGRNAERIPLLQLEWTDPSASYQGRSFPGQLFDLNGDSVFGLLEAAQIAYEQLQMEWEQELPYWNARIADRENSQDPQDTRNESVTLYQPPIQSGGAAAGGGRTSLCAGLLARPHRVVQGTRPGFGFSSTDYAVVAKFRFHAKGPVGSRSVLEMGEVGVVWREDFVNATPGYEGGFLAIPHVPANVLIVEEYPHRRSDAPGDLGVMSISIDLDRNQPGIQSELTLQSGDQYFIEGQVVVEVTGTYRFDWILASALSLEISPSRNATSQNIIPGVPPRNTETFDLTHWEMDASSSLMNLATLEDIGPIIGYTQQGVKIYNTETYLQQGFVEDTTTSVFAFNLRLPGSPSSPIEVALNMDENRFGFVSGVWEYYDFPLLRHFPLSTSSFEIFPAFIHIEGEEPEPTPTPDVDDTPTPTISHEYGSLSGLVTNQDGQPIPLVNIALGLPPSDQAWYEQVFTSDFHGRFPAYPASVPYGEWPVLAEKQGFHTYHGTVTVATEQVFLHIMLDKHEPVENLPREMHFQGYLTDANQQAIDSPQLTILFAIYQNDISGFPLWSETHNVVVNNGYYHVLLGSITPINLPFDHPYWLGVQVADDNEMEPRYKLGGAPYSFNIVPFHHTEIPQ